MKKAPLFLALALALCWLPHLCAFEGEEVMLLARTISAMAEREPEEVALMIGQVALNRAGDPRYPSDLRSVLDDYRQFRRSPVASERSVRLAERLMKGERPLAPDVISFEMRPGGYAFYSG